MKPLLILLASTAVLGAIEPAESAVASLRTKIQSLEGQRQELLKQWNTPCPGHISGAQEDQERHLQAQIEEAKKTGRLQEAKELQQRCNVISPAVAEALRPQRVTRETIEEDLKRVLKERLELEAQLQLLLASQAEVRAKSRQP